MNKQRYNNVDFLRFIFSVLIVYYHLLNNNIIPYVNNLDIYNYFKQFTPFLSNLVECFLILGGFFISISEQYNRKPFIVLCLDRLFRLWPVYCFYICIYFLFHDFPKEEALFNFAMLHATGISLYNKGIIWYIAPFFWASLLAMAIIRVCEPKKSVIILSSIAYFGCCLNINQTNGGFGRDVVFGFISLAFVQCLAVISIGIILQMIISEWKKHFTFKQTELSKLFFTFTELLILIFFFTVCFTNYEKKIFQNRFTIIILFSIILVLFINKLGFISMLLDKSFLGKFGKYSYSIYVMQQISFNILSKTLWRNELFMLKSPVIILGISLFFSILLGISVYYLIENPIYILWNNFKKQHLI